MKRFFLILIAIFCGFIAKAEDGSRLWLRYETVGKAVVVPSSSSATIQIAVDELQNYWQGDSVFLQIDKEKGLQDGAFEVVPSADGRKVTITAGSDIGILYGTYVLLRQQALGKRVLMTLSERPYFQLRLLNHWDNLDGSIERGYAGKSIFEWFHLDKARIQAYARANASIGINGSVLNNVNASPQILTKKYLLEVKKIADWLRPYGIQVFLSINFASPMALGDTKTADPLDAKVRKWWGRKAKEIYMLISDFGGFLVKANSEGQPGPGDYKRSHADGANMLADALKPHGGIVMWRSFVYGANHKGEDRVKQAVSEFKPCDGKFRDNVILQSKNGPLDFQPREPYAPIFDQMTETPQMAELQITQEYTGQSKHLVYLAPMWTEFFSFVSPDKLEGIAGVANIGDDANWCGHHFSQANWYAFGRLAWNPRVHAEDLATEWLMQTFTTNYYFVNMMKRIMMESREACVDYMMPLGLHHIFKFDHHYGPEPGGFKAEYPIEWCPVYYHKADSTGIGFDRTTTTGTGATAQYREPYASIYNKVETCPEEYLLWFHHLPWNYKMKNGKTLWEDLESHYIQGESKAIWFHSMWQLMRPYIDNQRWNEVEERLKIQQENAREWRDVCLKYFQSFSRMP
ncbi:MAG: alpha-glucuronidase [Prevotella sp.]|nr:alpha-glucuronidase [Prevotella sp.]